MRGDDRIPAPDPKLSASPLITTPIAMVRPHTWSTHCDEAMKGSSARVACTITLIRPPGLRAPAAPPMEHSRRGRSTKRLGCQPAPIWSLCQEHDEAPPATQLSSRRTGVDWPRSDPAAAPLRIRRSNLDSHDTDARPRRQCRSAARALERSAESRGYRLCSPTRRVADGGTQTIDLARSCRRILQVARQRAAYS